MPEYDGVGNFHHRGFKMQRHQDALRLGILHLGLIEFIQSTASHHCGIDDLTQFNGCFFF